jgi:hypothetical protein
MGEDDAGIRRMLEFVDRARRAQAAVDELGAGRPSITCPGCGRTSWNPNDVREGYCGFCHDWTRT